MAADRLEGLSPEGLATTVPLAAAGSRAIAGAIDLLVQILLIVLTTLAFKGDTVQAAIRAILIFVIIFFVPIAFDVLDRGRGPGKRIVGLRVVTLRGGPVGFRTSAVRNLLRIIDFLPTGYLIGIVSIFGTTTGQRIGDLAAGTVVSYTPSRLRKRKAKWVPAPALAGGDSVTNAQIRAALGGQNEAAFAVDAIQVTAAEVGLVQSFLARRATLPAEARARLAGDIASRLRPKVIGAPADATDEEFLELLATVKAIRG